MKTLKDSGYKGWPYLHRDLQLSPVTVVWWAKTPTGRQSCYLHSVYLDRLRRTGKTQRMENGFHYPVYVPTKHYAATPEEMLAYVAAKHPPPKLRRGYEWQGPFLYTSFEKPPSEGNNWGQIIAMVEPKESSGILMKYVVEIAEPKKEESHA